MCEKELDDTLEKMGRIPAVVIRETDDIGVEEIQPDVHRAAPASSRHSYVLDRARVGAALNDLIEASVVVLVENDRAEVAEGLSCERIEESRNLLCAADGPDEQIDRRFAHSAAAVGRSATSTTWKRLFDRGIGPPSNDVPR